MRTRFSVDPAILSERARCERLLCEGVDGEDGIRLALKDYWSIREEPTHYPDSLLVAAQLKAMHVDPLAIQAALLASDVAIRVFPNDTIAAQYGSEFAELLRQVRWLNELTLNQPATGQAGMHDQAELLRRMLLSMVEDLRVVLVKLAFRTQRLYQLAQQPNENSEQIARETLAIYAPLANRLGLAQVKWELEDVAFRIVDPDAYKRIARALEENRVERETYIQNFVELLDVALKQEGITTAQVFGRPKHLYSIWRKMLRKRIDFKDLFDVRAVRVLVEDLPQCYGVLGIVHNLWQPITREFDDYIARPKDNGYRSLHTAVIGPSGRPVEVQIRTFDMDQEAEKGVAAHWAYKEERKVDPAQQRGLMALRELLDDKDDAELVEDFSQQLGADRVYVFTPKGDVVDLIAGATPLDFAYQVHTAVGHRCRGAKVDGRIVPLTFKLQNGQQVEVLTTREEAPSRDWLNPSLGYLASSRARAKVRNWFNARDHAEHVSEGKLILERELRKLRATDVQPDRLVEKLRMASLVDLHAAIGKTDISLAQLAGAIEQLASPPAEKPLFSTVPQRVAEQARESGAIKVRGVGQLMTQIASCCKPVPHDEIVGFITRGKGVSIHRADCSNMLSLREQEQERLIEVEWGDERRGLYRVDIRIIAIDRQGLLRDVSSLLANEAVDVVAVNTYSQEKEHVATMDISLQVPEADTLSTLMGKLRQLRNIQSVERMR